MLKDPVLKQIIIIASILTGAISIVFIIAAYWYYSLLVGWVIGALLAVGTFFIKGWIMNHILKKNISSKSAFFFSILNTSLHFLIFGIAIFLILVINYASIGKIFIIDYADSAKVVSAPINLFTFIAGMHVIMLGIFISHIYNHIKEKKEKKHENI